MASIVCGAIGGLGFAGTAWLKLVMVSLGNPSITSDPAVVADFQHYQHANWHSFLEQTYGFINGIGVAVALALLLRRTPIVDESGPRRRWTEVFALFFVIPVLVYTNMAKNLNGLVRVYGGVDGQGGYQPVPSEMTAPLISSIHLTAWQWYTLLFAIVTIGFMSVAAVQGQRKIAIIPESWTGRGQLLFFLLCWIFVVGNFVKALPAFEESRLLTEGVILVNAVIVTVLLLLLSPATIELELFEKPRWAMTLALALVFWVATTAGLPWLMTKHVRQIYGNKSAGTPERTFAGVRKRTGVSVPTCVASLTVRAISNHSRHGGGGGSL